MKRRILLLSYRFPYPVTDGSRIRIYNLARILAKKYHTDFLAINEGPVARQYIDQLRSTLGDIKLYPQDTIRFKINTLKGFPSRNPLQVFYYHFPYVQRWIDKHYADYDLVFCFHIRMSRYLRKIADRRKVIDLVDATSMNYREAQRFARGHWRVIYRLESRRLLVYELKMLRMFDKAFITSHHDKAYLEHHAGRSLDNLVVIPNGVREDLFARPPCDDEKDWIVFLGWMGYAPNVDAVVYFAKEIFPLIRKNVKVKFLIVGGDPTKEVLRLRQNEDIEVTDFVEDPYEYLERAKVVVTPLRFGAGIQNKILEAMALGKAVVTTSRGARGIAGRDGEHFLAADDPKDMAEKVVRLLHDSELRKNIGKNARKLVERKYRWDLIGERLLAEIDEVLRG